MRARPLRRLQALLLLALLGATASGVPSHHHGEAVEAPIIAGADHHSHGVRLVDVDARITSAKTVVALPAVTGVPQGRPEAVRWEPAPASLLPPRERAPPSTSRPRAPPLPA
jgi:hypothetical protein